MKIALFVEGDSDEKTLTVLVKRMLGEQVGVICRVLKGQGNLLNERSILHRLTQDVIPDHPDVSKIIICVDSECNPDTERRLRQLERRLKKSVRTKVQSRYPIFCVLVTESLEGWLLADPDAITAYLGLKKRIDLSDEATLDCTPKKLIKDIFRRAGKRYIAKDDAPRIAERIDPDEIAKRNPSFEVFRQKVIDP